MTHRASFSNSPYPSKSPCHAQDGLPPFPAYQKSELGKYTPLRTLTHDSFRLFTSL
ncbi:conserved hypothetical protein [Ricinus communis]|uniref:Uncharacterized protein n=1 Tax=Ricinus communis TaxID=3988 RepID=B9RHI3_RICCO|nr:conserved hypothetical protein [Ricinus communis]